MDHSQLNWIVNFVWGVADDVLRDLYVRGKYRDVILPMTVLRRRIALAQRGDRAVEGVQIAADRREVRDRAVDTRPCSSGSGSRTTLTSPDSNAS